MQSREIHHEDADMSYASVGWTSAKLLSPKNFNQMETQYAAAKADIDIHGHPASHYLKTASDAKFFPIASGLDADKIDGLHLSSLVGNLIPPGAIWIYKGVDADFSSGYLIADPNWHQCDGQTINGIICPDMRGYFAKCPNTAATTGTGGAATATMTGTATVAGHALTLAEIASHYHKWTDRYYTGSAACDPNPYTSPCYTANGSYTVSGLTTDLNHAGDTDEHDHDTVAVSLNAINLTPLWRANWFICKVA